MNDIKAYLAVMLTLAAVCARGATSDTIAAQADPVNCQLDTRGLAVYRPKTSAELFPFAWNNNENWPTNGMGTGNATITWTEMDAGTNPDDPTKWSVRSGVDPDTVTGSGEGTTNWVNFALHQYKATLSYSTGTKTETAYFDLSKLPVLGETFAVCDHSDGGSSTVDLLVELGNPVWEKLVRGLIEDERLTVVCASTQEELESATTSLPITYSARNTPELLATGKCWVTINSSFPADNSVRQQLWRFVFK